MRAPVGLSLRQRLVGLACNAVVALAYGAVILGAGHGVAPIGLLLVLGDADEWVPPMLAGRLALGLLTVVILLPWRWVYATFEAAGVALLFVSWALFIQYTEVLPVTLAFSVPFLAASIGRLVYLGFELRRTRAGNWPP